MSMVCGLDLHRGQVTFDALELETGETFRGRIWKPDRARLRRWLAEELAPRANGGPVAVAVEGCTGWRYVLEEVSSAGFEAHLAEPADTMAARGRKKRAKTDRSDARLLRELLAAGELPESWVPPEVVLEWRERVRLYKALLDQRHVWVQRVHAELYQHGVALPEGELTSQDARPALCALALSPAGQERVRIGYEMIDATEAQAKPLRAELSRFGRSQPACRALAQAHYGIGGLLAVVVWSELGDCARFSRSEQVVRHAGLDITVDSSDRRRAGGNLARQGPGALRWALYEAAKSSSRPSAPDYPYYAAVKKARGGKVATISMARKLALRCYHTLRALNLEVVYATP
jgi:transposase